MPTPVPAAKKQKVGTAAVLDVMLLLYIFLTTLRFFYVIGVPLDAMEIMTVARSMMFFLGMASRGTGVHMDRSQVFKLALWVGSGQYNGQALAFWLCISPKALKAACRWASNGVHPHGCWLGYRGKGFAHDPDEQAAVSTGDTRGDVADGGVCQGAEGCPGEATGVHRPPNGMAT